MDNTLRTDLLPASLPLFWLAVAAILATALWVALHVTFIRQQRKPAFRFLFAFPVGAMAFWLASVAITSCWFSPSAASRVVENSR